MKISCALPRPVRLGVLVIALLPAGFATHVRADYVAENVILNQSNRFDDGPVYGNVLIEAWNGTGTGGGLSPGQVRLTFSAEVLPVYGKLGHFGIGAVGFMTDLDLSRKQIVEPKGWILLENAPLDGFGRFSWAAVRILSPRLEPVVLTIDGLGEDAVLDHFLIGSKLKDGGEPPQGSTAFAARVAGFSGNHTDDCVHAHWIGDPFPIPEFPEPGTLALALCGLGGLGSARWWHRRRHAA